MLKILTEVTVEFIAAMIPVLIVVIMMYLGKRSLKTEDHDIF